MSEETEAFGFARGLSKRGFHQDKNGKVAPNFPKSAKTVLSHPDHYGETKLILIKDSNLGMKDGVLIIPHYLASFLLPRSSTLPID